MTSEEPAEAIRRRMAELRRELICDMQEVSRSAKAMASPSFYIRKFPWATMAVVAGVGYLLVPKKKQVIQPDMKALAELVRKNQVHIDASKAANEKGILKSAAAMGLTWAARTGMNYLVQQMTTVAAHRAKEPTAAPSSPADEPSKLKR